MGHCKQLLFVVGIGRSGTSLAQSMIGSHSEVAFPPEFNYIRRYLITGKLERLYRKEGVSGVKERLNKDEFFSRLDMDIDQLLDSKIGDGLYPLSVTVYEKILQYYTERAGKKHCADKDPRTIEFLPVLFALWPEAHIVHVVRDPRDVLASKKKAAWSKKRHPILHIFAGMIQFELGQHFGKKLYASHYHELIYERLLNQPKVEMEKICNQIGLVFEPEMLNFNDTARYLVSESEMSWKKETLGPLLKDNTGKWRNSLNDFEIALVEKVSDKVFKSAGYECSNLFKTIHPAKKKMVFLIALLCKMLCPVYCFYRKLKNNFVIKRVSGNA